MVDKAHQALIEGTPHTVTVESHAGLRIDSFLTKQFPHYSRSFFQNLIDKKQVRINNILCSKGGITVKHNDAITISFPPGRQEKSRAQECSALNVEILFEHEHFLVINKPAGLLVHAPNHLSQELTLVDWLLARYQEINGVGYIDRPGIVHRLDKNTSGILIVPRTHYAHGIFGILFRERMIHKTYQALVVGCPSPEGDIEYAIGRDPRYKARVHAFKDGTQYPTIHKRQASTHFRVIKNFDHYSLLEVKPITGRTHQIRVHCAAIGHPLLGDSLYGTPSPLIARHALHAQSIAFIFNGEHFSFSKVPPSDFLKLIE